MSRDAAGIGAKLADITEEAAALILPLWRSGLDVMQKADESPVTVADQRAERLVSVRAARRLEAQQMPRCAHLRRG